jgi:hypothetical protein
VFGRDLAEGVLHPVKVFDQQVPVARLLAQQGLHRDLGAGIDLASLGHVPRPLAPAPGVFELADRADVVVRMIAHVPMNTAIAPAVHPACALDGDPAGLCACRFGWTGLTGPLKLVR